MNPSVSPATSGALEALEALTALAMLGAGPAEAQRAIGRLGQACPDQRLELLWERDGPEGAWRYTVVVRPPTGLTFSLGVTRDDALAWVIRGARRWSDGDLVRVNSTVVRVEQAIRRIDAALANPSLARRLVDECLIQQAIEREHIDVTARQLQEEMDAFRRTRRLYGTTALHEWLQQCRLTQVELEQLLESAAATRVLRRRRVAKQVEAYFEAHRAAFDTACVAQVAFDDIGAAQRALAAIRSGSLDLYDVALERFQAAGSRCAAMTVEMRHLMRRDAEEAWQALVFDSRVGEVVGPIVCDGHVIVARVLALAPATLDEPTRDAVERLLFDDWLRQQRACAEIEWFRGDEH